MTEGEKVPNYKSELEIYERELMSKIEEYKTARANWVSSNAYQNTDMKEKEGLNNLNIQKGRIRRFYYLNSRVHYKTLRPLRYYVLRRKVENRVKKQIPCEKPKGVETAKICTKRICTTTDTFSPEASEDDTKKKPAGLLAQKSKRRDECVEIKRAGPCANALKRLKAAKMEQSMIESCRCDDGREVTVVIKGICLCDKNGLNNLKLDKIHDEYSKLTTPTEQKPTVATPNKQEKDFTKEFVKPKKDEMKKDAKVVIDATAKKDAPLKSTLSSLPAATAPYAEALTKKVNEEKVKENPKTNEITKVSEGTAEPTKANDSKILHTVSSSEIHKKRLTKNFSILDEEVSLDDILKQEIGSKKVKFNDEDLKRKEGKTPRPKSKDVSELTLYKKLSDETAKFLSKDSRDNLRTHVEENQPEGRKNSREEKEVDGSKKLHRSKAADSIGPDGAKRSKSQTNLIEGKPKGSHSEGDFLENTTASMVTLFKSKPAEPSVVGLTKEQEEVLKKG